MAADEALESSIDRLYQGPLDEFVDRRNALARDAGKERAPAVRGLQKPNVLAWALNQLYWSSRKTFDTLVAAAARMRKAQADALLGRHNDLRAADAEHRQAIRSALKETISILDAAGHGATPDTTRVITAALEALPWKEPPGRLVRPPEPAGFDALAGMAIGRAPHHAEPAPSARRGAAPHPAPDPDAARRRARQAAIEEARAALASARLAESDATAKATLSEKRLDHARGREREAREALEDAERAARELEGTHAQAVRERDAAHAARREADSRLTKLERSVAGGR